MLKIHLFMTGDVLDNYSVTDGFHYLLHISVVAQKLWKVVAVMKQQTLIVII